MARATHTIKYASTDAQCLICRVETTGLTKRYPLDHRVIRNVMTVREAMKSLSSIIFDEIGNGYICAECMLMLHPKNFPNDHDDMTSTLNEATNAETNQKELSAESTIGETNQSSGETSTGRHEDADAMSSSCVVCNQHTGTRTEPVVAHVKRKKLKTRLPGHKITVDEAMRFLVPSNTFKEDGYCHICVKCWKRLGHMNFSNLPASRKEVKCAFKRYNREIRLLAKKKRSSPQSFTQFFHQYCKSTQNECEQNIPVPEKKRKVKRKIASAGQVVERNITIVEESECNPTDPGDKKDSPVKAKCRSSKREDFLRPLLTYLTHGHYKRAINYLLIECKAARKAFYEVVQTRVRKEIMSFAHDQSLDKFTVEGLKYIEEFEWRGLNLFMMEHMPLLYSAMLGAFSKESESCIIPESNNPHKKEATKLSKPTVREPNVSKKMPAEAHTQTRPGSATTGSATTTTIESHYRTRSKSRLCVTCINNPEPPKRKYTWDSPVDPLEKLPEILLCKIGFQLVAQLYNKNHQKFKLVHDYVGGQLAKAGVRKKVYMMMYKLGVVQSAHAQYKAKRTETTQKETKQKESADCGTSQEMLHVRPSMKPDSLVNSKNSDALEHGKIADKDVDELDSYAEDSDNEGMDNNAEITDNDHDDEVYKKAGESDHMNNHTDFNDTDNYSEDSDNDKKNFCVVDPYMYEEENDKKSTDLIDNVEAMDFMEEDAISSPQHVEKQSPTYAQLEVWSEDTERQDDIPAWDILRT